MTENIVKYSTGDNDVCVLHIDVSKLNVLDGYTPAFIEYLENDMALYDLLSDIRTHIEGECRQFNRQKRLDELKENPFVQEYLNLINKYE